MECGGAICASLILHLLLAQIIVFNLCSATLLLGTFF